MISNVSQAVNTSMDIIISTLFYKSCIVVIYLNYYPFLHNQNAQCTCHLKKYTVKISCNEIFVENTPASEWDPLCFAFSIIMHPAILLCKIFNIIGLNCENTKFQPKNTNKGGKTEGYRS